ncbi:MAG TPA: TonB-dependent receptor [Sphingomicrobium sp.]|jgi:hypothetical protein|nr:TonB-dependent receptor [Sphingomicrobium sp.]
MTKFSRLYRTALLTGIASIAAFPAAAQVAPASADPAVAPPPTATTAGARLIYTPADFARFAPKTAYDMLVQVPGFTIRSADQERGLGQASENVLINGQRINNKTGGAIEELRKISVVNVERIEIVEAASLGIAGLSGQVANIIRKATKKSSGQFEWNPDFRAHYSEPNLFNGFVSYTGVKGPVGYTFSVKDQANRGAFGGPIYIYDSDRELVETRNQVLHNESDLVTFEGKFAIDAPGSSVANLTLGYTPYWAPGSNVEHRVRADGDDRTRAIKTRLDGYYIDINGDYEFPVGPGRLKLIGLRHFDHEPLIQTQRTTFESGADDQGVRFTRDSRIGETVFRGEYGWKGGKNDWQVTFERAFNKLDQRGKFEELNADGEFEEVDFPGGSGVVQEVRYEGILTFSRALSSKLDLQVAAGAERSSLERVDGDLPARKFFRPKGSLTLGWRPSKGWDASFKLRRRVGQISFYDFLTQPSLSQDRENGGNPDLVPPQSWEVEGELGRELGKWGKTRMKVYAHRIDDIIDIIPLADGSEGVGNLPRATRFGFESKSTILFDPIGLKGAKLDVTIGMERNRVRDPLTGFRREISGEQDRYASVAFRHDIPGSKIAYGANFNHQHFTDSTFLTEVGRGWEGPVFGSLFVEHKDVFGLNVRAIVGNVFNARHRFERVVYTGRRTDSDVNYYQSQNQLIGPIFELLVRGNF